MLNAKAWYTRPSTARLSIAPWKLQVTSQNTPRTRFAHIKRLIRNATEMPLAQGLAVERNLFLKLAISEPALARMREYVAQNATEPSRGKLNG
jgi:hypothetical protein